MPSRGERGGMLVALSRFTDMGLMHGFFDFAVTVRVRPAFAGEGRYFVLVPEGTISNCRLLSLLQPRQSQMQRKCQEDKGMCGAVQTPPIMVYMAS